MSDTTRTVIVTGSSSGIGLDVARAFLDRGDAVVLNGRIPIDWPPQPGSAPPTGPRPWRGASQTRRPATRLVRTAVDRFGGIDVLVNNAGTFEPRPFVDVTEDELESYLHGNLKGTYVTTQAVVRQLKQQVAAARSSTSGRSWSTTPWRGSSASAPLVSKGGVHALTTSLAAELAPERIRPTRSLPASSGRRSTATSTSTSTVASPS